MLQLVAALLLVAHLDNLPACVQLRLIFACNSPEDLLMKKELDAFAAGYYGKFKVRLLLQFIQVMHRASFPCISLCLIGPLHLHVNHYDGKHNSQQGVPFFTRLHSTQVDIYLSDIRPASKCRVCAHAQVFYVVNAAPAEGHHLSLGVIDDEMLGKYLNTEPGSDVLIVSCGPPAFMADVKSVLQETGHAASTLVRPLLDR